MALKIPQRKAWLADKNGANGDSARSAGNGGGVSAAVVSTRFISCCHGSLVEATGVDRLGQEGETMVTVSSL